MLLSALRRRHRRAHSHASRCAHSPAYRCAHRSVTAALTAVAVALTTVLVGVGATAPAHAANKVTPGNFTGYGFDQCEAPSQGAMDAWLQSSPFWAVGIYIAGGNRACKAQTNLTPTWVDTQLRNGWRLLPINVGPQASCYTNPKKKIRIRTDPAGNYAAARQQARDVAHATIAAAARLGIAPGSTLWYDLEHAEGLLDQKRCRESALRFLSSWTDTLHAAGWVSGVYSNASSGIRLLDRADMNRPGVFTMPDAVWIARWNGQATVEIRDDYGNYQYLRPTSWMPHGRVHQYLGDHKETHGGVTINIDSNYMSLGHGTRPGRTPVFCRGVRVDFPRYRRMLPGRSGDQVTAAQCLLRRKKVYVGPLTGVVDERTTQAIKAYQAARGLRPRGVLDRGVWTSLLSDGRAPLLKVGSGGLAVRRVQRSLNAAVHADLAVTGIFDELTTAGVRIYQRERGLLTTGVVTEEVWSELQRGRL